MKTEQTSLFNIKPTKTSKKKPAQSAQTDKPAKSQKETNDKPIMTESDKIYDILYKKGIALRNHIYSHNIAVSMVLDYANGNKCMMGEDLEKLCKHVNKLKPHHYYHYKKGKFLYYDTWLLQKVLEGETHESRSQK